MNSEVDLRQLAIDRGEAAQPARRTRMRLLTRYVLPAVLVLGFFSLVAWGSRDLVFPPRPVTVIPVFSTTAEVRQEGTPLFQAAGWIEPRPTPIRVAALAPGVVQELVVVEDQPLRAGETVAKLVADDARLERDRARADLALRQAELDEATAALRAAKIRFEQPVHLEAKLGEADAALARIETALRNLPFETRRAQADHEAAQKDYESKRAAEGVVAGITIDIAKSKAESTAALVEELRDRDAALKEERAALGRRRDALKTQLQLLADETKARDEAQAGVQAASARVQQARVTLAEAELRLKRMTIVAPVDGRVFRLIGHPGTRIGSGMTQMEGHDGSTVVTMYRPDMLQVRVDVRFEDIPRVSLGQSVAINNPALPAPLPGQVLFVSSEADIQKNTLQVKVAIPDPPPLFKPEMLVDVTFLAPPQLENENTNAAQEVRIYVLKQLIREESGDPYVWVADHSAGVARNVRVTTAGTRSNGLVEIVDGLTIASRLIADGTDGLRDGEKIQVTGEHASLGTDSISGTRASAGSGSTGGTN